MIPDWECNTVVLAALLNDRYPLLLESLKRTLVDHGFTVRILQDARDIWIRDYFMIQIAERVFVKFRYDPDYLRGHESVRTDDRVLESFRSWGECIDSDIVLDGGNVVASKLKVILTDKIYKENPKQNRKQLCEKLEEIFQVDSVIVIPKEPGDPFGHSDGVMRFLSEERVVVNDYQLVHPEYGHKLRKVLLRHHIEFEVLPYSVENIRTDGISSAVGNYVNFLRTEKVLIVPAYGVREDEVALRKLESLCPGLAIVSLDCLELARKGGGVLNCITSTFRIDAAQLSSS